MRLAIVLSAVLALDACSDGDPRPGSPDAPTPPDAGAGGASAAAEASFELDADLADPARFFAFPYPSDLRLDAAGRPDVRGFPNPKDNEIAAAFKRVAGERTRFPVVPVAYFRFSAPVAPQVATRVLAAEPGAPILLVDVDPASPGRGTLLPVVAGTPVPDDFVPRNLLTVAARPGIILEPDRKYAFVVMRSLGDAAGAPLGTPAALAQLARGETPPGARGEAARALHAPLWETLDRLGVERAGVAAATVFTTGDVVRELAELTDALVARDPVTISNLRLDPDDGTTHPRYCELLATVRYPQFQTGVSPFDEPGTGFFEPGADGLPRRQGEAESPVVITLPRRPMPERGFPLSMYFHGSDGLSNEVVDRGPVLVPGGPEQKGEGPAHTLAAHGIGMAASGLPVSPERIGPLEGPCFNVSGYLNFCNLPKVRDDFRQGVYEQRALIAALRELAIPPEVVAGCDGLALPAGAAAYRFDPDQLVATGQSMGGMYTNLVTAVEPRIRAIVPTGAGGFWTYFLLSTRIFRNAGQTLAVLIGASDEWNFMHPALHAAELVVEVIDPMIAMPRIARRPLPGFAPRPIYEPVGKDDIYFTIDVFDAMALAYGNEQAGQEVWPSMQEALGAGALAGLVGYPVSQNVTSAAGQPYTGVVVQYEGDGIYDPHGIAFQLDAVKYQQGCFFSTFLETGVAVVPAPAPLGTPCPR